MKNFGFPLSGGASLLLNLLRMSSMRTFSPLVQMMEPFSPWDRMATTAMSSWWCTWGRDGGKSPTCGK